ncbi:MAG: aminotransferase class IV [Alphaproteobacteria bacterium]
MAKKLKTTKKNEYIFINNEIVAEDFAKISFEERGFLYGDGLFETIKYSKLQLYNFTEHLKRLKSGLKYLKIDFDCVNLKEKCLKLIAKNCLDGGMIRISISRGIGSIGYLPTNNLPLLIIQTKELPKIPNIINLIVSDYQPANFKFKSSNSINYVLAKIFATENNYYDSILLSQKKFIAETSSANIFWIKNNVIFTPNEDCGIVLGIIREKILKQKTLKVKCGRYQINSLINADEVFISNASIGIQAVDKIAFRNKKNIYDVNYKKTLVKNVVKPLKI